MSRRTRSAPDLSTGMLVAFRVSQAVSGASIGSADRYSSEPFPSKKIPTTSSPARTSATLPD
ncbi:MAG: hypothetical protein ABI682_15525 [Acidobacteriota bacterium]